MEEVISYFHSKNLKKIEFDFFIPFTGYKNSSDSLDRVKRIEHTKFVEEESFKMERYLQVFIDVFYKEFSKNLIMVNSKNSFIKMCRFGMYEPKIYSDTLIDSKFKVLEHMSQRIEEKEQDEETLVVFVIAIHDKDTYSIQDNLPFVNYIFFNV